MKATIALLLLSLAAHAAPTVSVEKGEFKNSNWNFSSISTPRRSDLAETAKLSLVSGELHKNSGPIKELANGSVSGAPDVAKNAVFLSDQGDQAARLMMDLGKSQEITQINSFSWHEYAAHQGARAPQVYTVYGSDSDAPDTADLTKWTKIAAVDTRPNTTGENWGGMYAVKISDGEKALGKFRYLLWEIQPTRSPKAPNVGATQTFFNEIDIFGPNTIEDAQPAIVVTDGPQLERIVLVYKTHFDIGYTDTAKKVVERYRSSMIDKALGVMDANAKLPKDQQFVWTIPGWPMKEILADWPGQTEVRKQRVHNAFQKGNFVVHALPFTPHTDILEPEELTRGLIYSSKLERSVGKPLPRDAYVTDVPCHSWIFPTLLKHAGVDYLHIGCNGHSSPVEVPLLFWWEGPDGSRLLTFYSPNGYGAGLMPPRDWPHKTWLAMIFTGDNHGPPEPNAVANDIKALQARFPNAKITVGSFQDFGDALVAEKPDLPVIHKDMPDTWIHGPMGSPIAMKSARNAGINVSTAEMLGTLIGNTTQSQDLAKVYEEQLKHKEHTWGLSHAYHRHQLPDGDDWAQQMDTKTPGLRKRFEDSWIEHDEYALTSEKITNNLIKTNLETLASSVNVEGKRTVVFNPLPWKRSGEVIVNGITRYVKDVPANGWKVIPEHFTQETPKISTGAQTLETPFYKVTLSPDRAAITSVIEKSSGRELVKQDSKAGLGEYFYQQFTRAESDNFSFTYTRNRNAGFGKFWLPKDVPHIDAYPTNPQWTVVKNGEIIVATATCAATEQIPNATELRVTLYQNSPAIDLQVTVKDKKPTPRPEAGWICLPLNVETPAFRLGRNGGIVDPAKDFIAKSNHHLLAVDSGLTVTDPQGKGVGICSTDTPLVSLDKPGCWEFSRIFVPEKPNVYVNLYNNMWSTNFRMWIDGTWSSQVRIWPVDSYDPESSLETPSWETRKPLIAATADGKAGKLPAEMTGPEVSRKGVLVTAFGPNPDGEGTVLRVWERAGRSGPLTITLPKGYSSVYSADLRGTPTSKPSSIENNKITLDLKANSPASFILK